MSVLFRTYVVAFRAKYSYCSSDRYSIVCHAPKACCKCLLDSPKFAKTARNTRSVQYQCSLASSLWLASQLAVVFNGNSRPVDASVQHRVRQRYCAGRSADLLARSSGMYDNGRAELTSSKRSWSFSCLSVEEPAQDSFANACSLSFAKGSRFTAQICSYYLLRP